MALELTHKYSVNLGSIVRDSVTAITSVRTAASTEKQAAFYSAVANGMSYDAQVKFLQNEFDTESTSSFKDPEYLLTITKQLGDTKKLARFDKYRTNYANILADLKAGKDGARDQLETLKGQLDSITDPELKQEVTTEIGNLETLVTNHEQTILSNEVKKATYDGTQKVLKSTLGDINDARAAADIRGDEETVAMLDAQKASVNQQLQQVKVTDAISSFTVKSATTGVGAKGKLSMLQSQVADGDSDSPITISGVSYGSAKEYWQTVLGNYVNGNGSGQFSDFFNDLAAEMKTTIDAATARDGFPTNTVLTGISSTFDNLATKPEFAGVLEKLGQYKTLVLNSAIDANAKATIDRAAQSPETLRQAEQNLATLQATYGVNTDTYRLELSANAADYVGAYAQTNGVDPSSAAASLGLTGLVGSKFAVPGGTPAVPGAPAAPGSPLPGGNLQVGSTGDAVKNLQKQLGVPQDGIFGAGTKAAVIAYQSKNGLVADGIVGNKTMAALTGVPPTTPPGTPNANNVPTPPAPTAFDINQPTYTVKAGDAKNPWDGSDLKGVTPGTVLNKPVTPPTPPPANTPPTVTPAAKPTVTPPPATPPAAPKSTPTPPPAAPTPTPPSTTYNGASIVDFLSTTGKDSSYAARKQLASSNGIQGYTGSAEQNSTLLKKLRGF